MALGTEIALIKALGGNGGGGTGGVLVVHETVSGDTHTLDKTYQEIADAEFAVLIFEGTGRDVGFYFPYALESYGSGGNAYFVQFNAVIYMASNTSDYPYYVDEQSMQ